MAEMEKPLPAPCPAKGLSPTQSVFTTETQQQVSVHGDGELLEPQEMSF